MPDKEERISLKSIVRCDDPVKSKQIVLDSYPDAFCQITKNGWTKRKEYTIQRLTHKANDPEGDYRDDLGCTGETEDMAWMFAADNILREKEKLSTLKVN